MKMQTDEIAARASLAMILEAASCPKPGNVHRLKDFKDTSFEHFLASAVSVQSVFKKATDESIGSLFYEAVSKTRNIQNGGNTHFGTFILLIPLVKAAANLNNSKKQSGIKEIVEKAAEFCRQTIPEDAVRFYEAFRLLPVYVNKTKSETEDSNYDLTNPKSIESIKENGTTLLDLMKMSAERDMVAAEWMNGFEKSCLFAEKLLENKTYFEKNPKKGYKSEINSAVALTFLEFMAAFPDTFIATKSGAKNAEKVRRKADKILKSDSKNLKKRIPKIKKFDKNLRKKKMNPGSLADIAAAGIFIALLEGMKI